MTEISIKNDKPDIYEKLKEKFGVLWDDGIIIADKDSIHCKYQIPPEKIIHELVHIKQQKKAGRDLWWELYLSKDSFRLEQEVEAYREEYKFICENVRDRNARFQYLYELSRILSSPQYGKLCTFSEAMKLIQ